MIKRYSRKELTDIWSEENKYKIWLDVVEKILGKEIMSNPVQNTRIKQPEKKLPKGSVFDGLSGIGGEDGVADSQADIEQLEAEMERLQAEMEKKKAALESSKKEPLTDNEPEKESLDEEKERLSIEASDAIVKAEEEVELAKEEVAVAIQRAEQEEAEAEEARLVAEMEEDEAREAKAEAEAAKRRLDAAVRKAELAGKDAETYTDEMEREKREGLILERVTQRGGSLDWSKIGISEGGNPDDLTLINGIDEFTQRKLNALGIFTFRQVANIDSVAGKAVNDSLELLPGKVSELEWAKQAITMLELRGVDESSRKPEVDDDNVIADLSAAQIKWATTANPDVQAIGSWARQV